MLKPTRTVIASAVAAVALVAGASAAGAQSDPDLPVQDTTLGHVFQFGQCQAVSQSLGAGIIGGGAAAQTDCNAQGVCCGGSGEVSFQDTVTGHVAQSGGSQVVSQSIGSGVISGGMAWQG